MNDIDKLFFELIRVSVGACGCLSKTPSSEEWEALYGIAKKQCLIGISFTGVQRLQMQEQCPPEQLYLQWMGMAAKIQQRNIELKRRGDALVAQLLKDGMDACVLKGQSVAALYKLSDESLELRDLSALRQSGDIDLWLRNRTVHELDAYVRGLDMKPETTAAHVIYEDDGVEIELHAVPAFMRCPWTNARLKEWFQKVGHNSAEFNLVYLMVHMYHHVLFEGLGLRQVMDYYFALRAVPDGFKVSEVSGLMKELGMEKFANGMMWIMKEVFRLEEECLICEADVKIGGLLLDEIMSGGNFGKHSDEKGLHSESIVVRGIKHLERNMRFFMLAPGEIICSPLWSAWHWCWRKKNGYLN